MTEYIDRKLAIKALCSKCTACNVLSEDKEFYKAHCAEIRALQSIPAADVVDVGHCMDCIFNYGGFSNDR